MGIEIHDGQAFTTKDRDNDNSTVNHCANKYMGAWWYSACHKANLNGLYHDGNYTDYGIGINWSRWKGYFYSLKTTEMKTRRAFFPAKANKLLN